MRARPLIVSDQAYTKLRMNIIIPFNAAEASTGITIPGNHFLVNTFDPSQLPAGLQRWSQFYSQYTILGTKIRVSPIWADPTVGVPIQYSMYPANENDAVVTDPNEVNELPYSRFNLYRGPGQSRGQFLSSFMGTNKLLGQKTPYARIEDEVSGEFSGSAILEPARTWNWHIRVTNIDGQSLPITQYAGLRLNVRVVYYCRFFGRRNVGIEPPAAMEVDLANKFKSL